MASSIQFESDLFNTETVHAHFINECCFGEDVGQWLGARLRERGYAVTGPGQEDWGWYIEVERDDERHCVNIGLSDTWLLIVERRRRLSDLLAGSTKDAAAGIMADLTQVLSDEPSIRNVASVDPPG
jgi:hypothetical protein